MADRVTLELPRDPLLRALAIYGVLAFAAILVGPILIRAFGLPAWLSNFVILFAVLGAPVVAAGVWLVDRRR